MPNRSDHAKPQSPGRRLPLGGPFQPILKTAQMGGLFLPSLVPKLLLFTLVIDIAVGK
jgi:hypothetical protein